MSSASFLSFLTMLVPADSNATAPPSAESTASAVDLFASTPEELSEARAVCLVWRSWTNASQTLFASPAARLLAPDSN